jgi:hypothetical protein
MYSVKIECADILPDNIGHFQFSYGPIIFDRVIPLALGKDLKIHNFKFGFGRGHFWCYDTSNFTLFLTGRGDSMVEHVIGRSRI